MRRQNTTLPLKPFLPQLVELLEDTDGTVRECARQSVVELFTGSTVTDAARADLKKEMAKKKQKMDREKGQKKSGKDFKF